MRVIARKDDHERLEVSREQLTRLDTTTLADVGASIAISLHLLDGEERPATRDELRRALRVIEGGGE